MREKSDYPITLIKKSKILYRFIILFLLFALFISHYIYALDPNIPIKHYLLDEWGIETGLNSESVQAIVQTPDGFLWLGTGEGMFRYDGISFESIEFKSQDKVFHPSINALLVDDEGGIWVGARELFYYKKGVVERLTIKEFETAGFNIRCLELDSYNNLWFGTFYDYLYRYKDGKFTKFNESSGLGGKEIYSILEDSRGHLWVANADYGLYVFNNQKFVKHEIQEIQDEYSVYKVYEDHQGILWLGTNIGLLGLMNAGTNEEKMVYLFTPYEGLSDNNIWSIIEDYHGNLWLGTQNGLNKLRKELDGQMTIEKRCDGEIIRNLFEDKEENLWIGTLGSHLKQLKEGTFITYWKDAGVPLFRISLHQDSHGIIRLGSTVGNLYQFNQSQEKFFKILSTQNNTESEIYAIEEDSKGGIWIGLVKRGIIYMNPKNKTIKRYTTEDGLSNNQIRTIFQDSQDRIWIGTIDGGINCYKNGKFYHCTTAEGLVNDLVFEIHEDAEKNIWVGTKKGISILKKGQIYRERITNHFFPICIIDIYADEKDKDIYWIGTYEEGLIRFNIKTYKTKTFTKKDGLASNEIYKIMEDQRGNFWIGAREGIFRVSKKDLNAGGDINKKNIHCIEYDFSDGLMSRECRIGARNSAIKTSDGELWFGTRKGISIVNPGKASINKHLVNVTLKKILVNYNEISLEKMDHRFKGLKTISFEFSAPTFISPKKVKIKYMLDGYDENWKTVHSYSQRVAHFQNLPPGDYRFLAKACNSNGVWNKAITSYHFTVAPYFYQTIPFKLFLLIFVFVLIVILYNVIRQQLYMKNLKRKYKNSTLDPQKAESCLKKLLYLLETKKLYKDETISLNSLAKKLSIAPRYLSQIINEQLNKNFRELLNNYRIEEAKRMLLNPGKEESPILEIAYEVGFNSKEVFNRCFKKYTDMTPSEFKKLNKNNLQNVE